jgi:hypothetical protein
VSVDNLKRVLDQATPADQKAAMDSFFKYNRLMAAVAAKHGYTTRIGAAVFSALSPNNDYHGNLRDVHKMLEAARAGKN